MPAVEVARDVHVRATRTDLQADAAALPVDLQQTRDQRNCDQTREHNEGQGDLHPGVHADTDSRPASVTQARSYCLMITLAVRQASTYGLALGSPSSNHAALACRHAAASKGTIPAAKRPYTENFAAWTMASPPKTSAARTSLANRALIVQGRQFHVPLDVLRCTGTGVALHVKHVFGLSWTTETPKPFPPA